MESQLKQLIEKTDFEKLFAQKGYAFFTNGDYNLNIIGIRNLIGAVRNGNVIRMKHEDRFNDALLIVYKVNGQWVKKLYEITTDAGLKLLRKPSNAAGTALLVPGQYRGVYKVDLHRGKYQALCQRNGNVAVYRDKNKDGYLDMDPKTIQRGMFGINIHKAGSLIQELIGGNSAGCQVFKRQKDFNEFMQIVNKSKDLFGNSFTYTLVTTDDLK